jgi:hypothetical protein
MTIELEVQKALWLYHNDHEFDAFNKLLTLATAGEPHAQYYFGLICQENKLLYLASDTWQDLLAHEVEPRKPVAELLYEIYSWTGDIASTEYLITEENLPQLRNDLAARNYIADRAKTATMAGGFLVAARQATQALSESWTYKEALKLLEAKANLSVISSQIAYSEEPFVGGQSVIASGSEIWTEDLDKVLNDAITSWKDVRDTAVELILQLSEQGKDDSPEVAKVSGIALEAQERLFFFAGSIELSEEDAKICLNNIAYGLQWTNKVASSFYLVHASSDSSNK